MKTRAALEKFARGYHRSRPVFFAFCDDHDGPGTAVSSGARPLSHRLFPVFGVRRTL